MLRPTDPTTDLTVLPDVPVDGPIRFPAPEVTMALLAPAGSQIAVATSWVPHLHGIDSDGTVHATAVLSIDLPAQDDFWARTADRTPGVAAALLTVAGHSPALQVTCCHAGHAPVTTILDLSSCAAAAALAVAAVTGDLALRPAEQPTDGTTDPDTDLPSGAVLVPLPDALLADIAVGHHRTDCGTCGL